MTQITKIYGDGTNDTVIRPISHFVMFTSDGANRVEDVQNNHAWVPLGGKLELTYAGGVK